MCASGLFNHHMKMMFQTAANYRWGVRSDYRYDREVHGAALKDGFHVGMGSAQLGSEGVFGCFEGHAGFVDDDNVLDEVEVAESLQKEGAMALLVGLHYETDPHVLPNWVIVCLGSLDGACLFRNWQDPKFRPNQSDRLLESNR